MPKVRDWKLYQVISFKKLNAIENYYLNDNKIDINRVVYFYERHAWNHQLTLLEIAVRRLGGEEDLPIINYLLKNGTDINKSGEHNRTSLTCAIEKDDLYIVKLLISKGADINLVHPDDGNTPLAMAVRYKKPDIVKYLINLGANICKVGKNGKAPLVWAVENNDLKIITELLDYSAEVKHAVHTAFMRAIELDYFEIFQLLIKRGGLINFIYKNGHTPLTMAISLSNVYIVRELIQNGAEVNMNDSNGNCPLIQAIEMSNFHIVKSIIDSGANLNIISKSGCSPLTLAILKENFAVVKYLVNKGADVNQLSDQKSPLLAAAANYNIPIFEFLIKCGANLNSVAAKIKKIASANEDFFIYFNSLKENMKKLPDVTSSSFTGHEEASS